jgi:hypothetical protein
MAVSGVLVAAYLAVDLRRVGVPVVEGPKLEDQRQDDQARAPGQKRPAEAAGETGLGQFDSLSVTIT